MSRYPFAAVVLAAAVCSAPVPAQQVIKRQGVKEAAADIAKAVREVATTEKLSAVRVGRFTPINLDPDTAGLTLAAEVAHALGDLIDPKAESEVVGSYSLGDDTKVAGAKVLRVQAKLLHVASGKVLKNALVPETEVRFNTDIARLLAITGAVDVRGNFASRNKQIQKLWAISTTAAWETSASVVSPVAGSKYGVEVRLRPEQGERKPVPAVIENGQGRVKLSPGAAFEVRILNAADEELAVAVAVDGLDVFAATADKDPQSNPLYTHVVVPAAKDGKPGEFVLTGRHKTATAGKLNWEPFRAAEPKGATVGMIHLAFEPAWDRPAVTDERKISGLDARGKLVQRAGDVPTEFLTLLYQK
jgi:hypothetical protein